jgi:RimJ/RimL family protein N-acetyltransferase
MIIKTDRLLLRPLCSSDLKTVHEYAGDIENTKYMLFLPNATEKETEAFLAYVEQEWKKEHPSAFEFAIVLNGVQIGGISISIGETPN